MPAEMLHFGEWAAAQGLETMAPGTWTAYTEYVRSYGVPVEPAVEPTPKPPTVTVVNRSQQVRSAALRPDPAYSRQIALELHIPGGAGGEDFCFTPPLGNTLVLYGIDLWMRNIVPASAYGGFIYLMYGAGVPPTGGVIAVDWSSIVPLYCGQKPGFRIINTDCEQLHFTMKKKFVWDAIRFGCTIENLGAPAWEATILFEISEG